MREGVRGYQAYVGDYARMRVGAVVGELDRKNAVEGMRVDLGEGGLVHIAVLEVAVAYAYRVDDGVVAHGVLDGLVDAKLACGVVAVGDEYDGAARRLGCLREDFAHGERDGVPDGRAASQLLFERRVVVLADGARLGVLDPELSDGVE